MFGLGLTITVAPLTAAILGSISERQAGIGSAVNNAIARIAGLIAIAMLGVIVGAELDSAGFHRGVLVTAALLIVGGLVSAVGISNRQDSSALTETSDVAGESQDSRSGEKPLAGEREKHDIDQGGGDDEPKGKA